ncbi:hypothetical protein GCM10023144_24220 [Pigmentiphaga soli]|uniref:Uncharacterized protein n=1 Tax=Pigmentiphaga soli TaxID=1007095 RepID=A0ABP8H1Y9_9BURK
MPHRYLEKDILPHIGSKPVRNITAEDVSSVIWRKKEQGFDAGQVRGVLKCMSGELRCWKILQTVSAKSVRVAMRGRTYASGPSCPSQSHDRIAR